MCPVNAMGLRSFRLTMENGVRVVRLVHTNAMMLCFDRPDRCRGTRFSSS